jgi:hypothetical protein
MAAPRDPQIDVLISRGIPEQLAVQLAAFQASVERNLTGPMSQQQMNQGIERVATETGIRIQNNTNTQTGRRRTHAKKGKGRSRSRSRRH